MFEWRRILTRKSPGCAILLIWLLFLSASCVTADKDRQTLDLNGEKGNSDRLLIYWEHDLRGASLRGEARFLLLCDVNLMNDALHFFIVDNPRAAFYNFCRDYIAVSVSLKNKSPRKIRVKLDNFRLTRGSLSYPPIPPEKLPRHYSRINWKGSLKNIYNLSVGTLAAAFVIAAVAACVKEGKCENMRFVGDVVDLSRSGERDPQKMFSSFEHQVTVKYPHLLLTDFELEPGGAAEGVLFFKRNRILEYGRLELRNL